MKGMFLCNHGCQDIQPAIVFMVTTPRLLDPMKEIRKKLAVNMMTYLKATKDEGDSKEACEHDELSLSYKR
jgi:hypothetical protein